MADPNRTVIAICGIDGAGKSTLVDALVERLRRHELPAVVARKRSKADVEAVEWLHGRRPGPRPTPRTGPFGEAVRLAYAFDFLRFYREEVCGAPGAVVVADRWTPCAITYAAALDTPAASARLAELVARLLAPVPAPDALVYLDVEPAEAVARIRRRGRQKDDEHISILAACRDAYEEWLPRVACPQLRIPEVDPAEALARAEAFVRPFLPPRPSRSSRPSERPGR